MNSDVKEDREVHKRAFTCTSVIQEKSIPLLRCAHVCEFAGQCICDTHQH